MPFCFGGESKGAWSTVRYPLKSNVKSRIRGALSLHELYTCTTERFHDALNGIEFPVVHVCKHETARVEALGLSKDYWTFRDISWNFYRTTPCGLGSKQAYRSILLSGPSLYELIVKFFFWWPSIVWSKIKGIPSWKHHQRFAGTRFSCERCSRKTPHYFLVGQKKCR